MIMIKDYLKKTLTNRYFWRIQWLNLMYIVKYTVKYRLIIIAYSLSMSYLYVQLTANSSGLFTKMQSEAIVSACIAFFIVARNLWLFTSLGRLIMPNSGNLEKAKRWNNVFRQFLFVILMSSSKYLKTDLIFQNTSVKSIPKEMIVSGVSAIFCLVTMIFCIRQFWKRLDKQMIILDFTSNEPLNTDVCSQKVSFFSDWNEYVQVIETGITYRNKQNGDLFYVFPDRYELSSGTELETQVSLLLKYSFVTGQLNRLNAPRAITARV